MQLALIILIFVAFVSDSICALRHEESLTHREQSFSLERREVCCGSNMVELSEKIGLLWIAPEGHMKDLNGQLTLGIILYAIATILLEIQKKISHFLRRHSYKALEIFTLRYLWRAFSKGIIHPKKYNLVFSG